MNKDSKDCALLVRMKGPGVRGGRVALKDLLFLGQRVQDAVEGVARILSGQAESRRPGPKPKEIWSQCELEVVALNKGSFEIALDVPRVRLEVMHLGLESIEKMLDGIQVVGSDDTTMPPGYDFGVLHSVREFGQVLNGRVTAVEFETDRTKRRVVRYDAKTRDRVIRRILAPVSNLRSIEGRLLMADFKHEGTKCRVHPPVGKPVVCDFDENMAGTVQELLRRHVRVSGEAQIDPYNEEVKSIRISDIAPLERDVRDAPSVEEFWLEKSVDDLAEEQSVQPLRKLDDILGKGAALWKDDNEFEGFLSGIASGRHQGEPA